MYKRASHYTGCQPGHEYSTGSLKHALAQSQAPPDNNIFLNFSMCTYYRCVQLSRELCSSADTRLLKSPRSGSKVFVDRSFSNVGVFDRNDTT